MKKILLVIGFLVTTAMPNMSHATELWTGSKKIVSIQVVSNGGFVVYFDSDVNAVCTAAGINSLYVYAGGPWGVTAAAVQAFLATALSAYHAGSTVNISYDDTSPYCWGRQMRISK